MSQFPGFTFLQSLSAADLNNLSLDNFRRLMTLLGNPQDQMRSVHVTGTNGKGSTSACIAAMLHAAGYHVGLYTSPYLSDVTECCTLDGLPVSKLMFDRALCRVADVVEQEKIQISYFEARTAACFVVFEQARLDWAVIEVGLGGRLDATNCLHHPELTVITGIALDHAAILGSTLEQIALEKCGIFKKNAPAVIGLVSDEVRDVIRQQSNKVGIPCYFAGHDFVVEPSGTLRDITGRFDSMRLPLSEFALHGQYQRDNLAVGAYVALMLGLSSDQITTGARNVRWPGRLELRKLESSGSVLFDAAHNPQGMESLGNYLDSLFRESSGFKKLVVVFGALESKDWKSMLRTFSTRLLQLEKDFGVRAFYYFTKPPHSGGQKHTAVTPAALVDYLGTGFAFADYSTALAEAQKRLDLEDLMIVCGSIYLMGAVRAQLVREPFATIVDSLR